MLEARSDESCGPKAISQREVALLKSASKTQHKLATALEELLIFLNRELATVDQVVTAYFTDLSCGEKQLTDELGRLGQLDQIAQSCQQCAAQSEHYRYFIDEQTIVDRAITHNASGFVDRTHLFLRTCLAACEDANQQLTGKDSQSKLADGPIISATGFQPSKTCNDRCIMCCKKTRAVPNTTMTGSRRIQSLRDTRTRVHTSCQREQGYVEKFSCEEIPIFEEKIQQLSSLDLSSPDVWRKSVLHDLTSTGADTFDSSVDCPGVRVTDAVQQIPGLQDKSSLPGSTLLEPGREDRLTLDTMTRAAMKQATSEKALAGPPAGMQHAPISAVMKEHKPPVKTSLKEGFIKRSHTTKVARSRFGDALVMKKSFERHESETHQRPPQVTQRRRAKTMQNNSSTSFDRHDKHPEPPRNWNTSSELMPHEINLPPPKTLLQKIFQTPQSRPRRVMHATDSSRQVDEMMSLPKAVYGAKARPQARKAVTVPLVTMQTVDEDFAARWYDM